MFWNLTFTKFVLKKDLQWQQIVGALAVVLGVCTAAFPADGGPGLLSGVRVPVLRPPIDIIVQST